MEQFSRGKQDLTGEDCLFGEFLSLGLEPLKENGASQLPVGIPHLSSLASLIHVQHACIEPHQQRHFSVDFDGWKHSE